MTKSITSQLSAEAIYQILEIIASEIDDIDDKELSITFDDQMNTLTLTDLQYGALYVIVRDAVDYNLLLAIHRCELINKVQYANSLTTKEAPKVTNKKEE